MQYVLLWAAADGAKVLCNHIRLYKSYINAVILLQIIPLIPRTVSGKNVRVLLKRVAQHPSMEGKQEVDVTEIQKYSNFDAFMQVSNMLLIHT